MLRLFLPILFTVGLTLSAQTVFAAPQQAEALAPLHSLIGDWTGTAQDGKVIRASYQFTSGGTSLTETLAPEKEPAMTTMYHLDGNRLMLTHYCSLNNQPRMRANDYQAGDKTLTFTFVDATNLASPSDPHMHQVIFAFQDHDHFTQTWVLSKDGKDMPHIFHFERMK